MIGQINVGRQDGKTIGNAIFKKRMHLVRIVHVGGEGCGHELSGMMRLEVGGLECDQGIRRRVRFVETVARKFFHQIEEFNRITLCQPIPGGACNKNIALQRHFFNLFLTHCPPQQIGAAETIPPIT